jgi:hypothetical protein
MNGLEIPNIFLAKTAFGTFQVKITNRTYISIGAKKNCVQIGYNTDLNEATLDWLGTEQGGCEQNGKTIKGTDTIAMTDLGFTILKNLYPDVKQWIKLRDSSKFNCNLPDGNRYPISNMIYNLLLNGETYYQKKFKAVPLFDEAYPAYETFYSSWKSKPLPSSFSFQNNDLSEMLMPIYKRSNNWQQFFQELYTIYGRNTCLIMHSWYLNVYSDLARVPITTDWKIDIHTREIIPYEITSVNSIKNYTRKTYAYDPYNFSGGYFPAFIQYKDFVNSVRNDKTRKVNK